MLVSRVIEKSKAIDEKDAELLRRRLTEEFQRNTSVVLDFKDITIVSPVFLRESIGKFCEDNDKNEIRNKLRIKNVSSRNQRLLKSVLLNSMNKKSRVTI